MNNDTQPAVSVIVPVYNVERYIRNCLDSLLNQSFRNWEAILVDDGSPDRSGAICEEYAARDSRFKVVHKKNGGMSSARNLAMNYVQGESVFYLDSDDYLHPATLQHLVDLAVGNDAGIVQCNFIRGSATSFPDIEMPEVLSIYDNHSVFTQFAAKIIPCGKLYRRDVIGDIRFPEGIINEDDFTTWKYYYNAAKTVVTNMPLYYYTVNPNSIMANQQRNPNLNYFNAYRERIEFFHNSGEKDLEAISRVQWMKSLVMLYSNKQLTDKERREVKSLFKENYRSPSLKAIRIPAKLRIVFGVFAVIPMVASKLVKRLYKAGV